jgi:hypothetical protein
MMLNVINTFFEITIIYSFRKKEKKLKKNIFFHQYIAKMSLSHQK